MVFVFGFSRQTTPRAPHGGIRTDKNSVAPRSYQRKRKIFMTYVAANWPRVPEHPVTEVVA